MELAQSRCFPGQDEKSGLEGVLRVRLVAQDATAHAKYHWTMAADQRFQGEFLSALREATQKFVVAGIAAALRGCTLPHLLQDEVESGGRRHGPLLAGGAGNSSRL